MLFRSRQFVPPGIALEHLRKPSINPSPESDSINLNTILDYGPVPTEVDGAITSANPGTSKKKPKVAKKPSAEAMQIDSDLAEVESQPMEIDPAPDEAEAGPMEVDEQLFPLRPIPSWAKQIMDYLAEGKLPNDEAGSDEGQR